MKQYAAMFLMLIFGVGGSLFASPALGVIFYYFFACLRPQFLWKFQLSAYPGLQGITWSFYLAAASIGSYLLWSIGLLSYGKNERTILRHSPYFNMANWGMMIFAFWITMSYLFSNDRIRSDEWYGEYLKIFVMYFVAARVIRTPNQLWTLYTMMAVALAYIALDANQIYLSSGNVVLYRRGFALLDNNGAGLLLALGAPLCFFAFEMTRGWYRWLYLFGVANIVHAVLTTYSRGAMLAMLVPCVLHYPFFIIMYSKTFMHGMLKIIVFGGLLTFGVSIMAGKEIVARFTSIENREVDHSYQSRQLSWRIAVEIANDYPFVGAGIRCSALEMLKRGADMEGRTIHSQYLQIAADSGWVALVLYLAMVACTFIVIWKARLKLWRRKDPDARRAVAILNGIECALVTFLVGALALSLEVFEPSYLLLFIGAQVWALINARDTQKGFVPPVPPKVRRPMPPPNREAASRQGPRTGKHPFARFQQPSMPRPHGS